MADKAFLPGGVPSLFGRQQERTIIRGKGGRVWDQSGRMYIDLVCGYGPIILGHADDEVNQVVYEQMQRGAIFPALSEHHAALKTLLQQYYPGTEDVLYLKTGSEAVSAAIRIARAYTGKPIILRCGFHGWHDAVIAPYRSWHRYDPDPKAPRPVPGVWVDEQSSNVLAWNGVNIQDVEMLFHSHSGQIAAIILDPIQIREPIGENLHRLRMLASREGALLIFDEIKTGFRVGLRGVQGLYPVQADLTLLSKAISNGFPLAVVLCPKDLARVATTAKIMGTYNSELLSIVAAMKTIEILSRPGNMERISQTGQQLIEGMNRLIASAGYQDRFQAVPYRWPMMPFLYFNDHLESTPSFKKVLFETLACNGMLMLENHMSFVCLAHDSEDIQTALQIFGHVLESGQIG